MSNVLKRCLIHQNCLQSRFYYLYMFFQQFYVIHGQPADTDDRQPLIVEENIHSSTLPVQDEMSTIQIVSKIWPWIIAIFANFSITLMLFPALAVLVESTGKGSVSRTKLS